MQLLLQQAMLGSSIYNPYMALLAGGGMNPLSGAGSNDLTAAFNSLLASPATSGKNNLTSAASTSQQAKSNAAAASLEASLNELSSKSTADLMSNPALLASMLGVSPMALLPGTDALAGLDPVTLNSLNDATALWLASQLPKSSGTDAVNATKAIEAKGPGKSTPTLQQKKASASGPGTSKGKLNLVVEKLANNNSSNPKQ